ncbi:type VI secretion system Vgr family protein, partial [Pseudomonas agarici]|uniref:type VI secretion system Vgr family protein n=2 Tax=Pseudomonas agarici TaxID=46677 RepID=UPI00035DC587
QLQAAVLAALGPPPDAIDALYVNQFNLIPARQTYRPQTRDGHGRRLHPRPTVQGSQSALVIGDGDPLLTDRDHRIKVQFHWQRGTRGSSLEPHPRGTDNAPGDARIGTWVRVAATQAGSNWGSVWIPRVGQEVLVDFLEGDIDRPVVIGALYNGQGWDNAAHNQVGGGPSGCTGNAPAWFPGNQHAGVLSGWKTQDLSSSRTGNGGYRHLQFDDSPGQSRLELYTTDQHSGLSLGHLKQTQDNQRLADRGYGSELHTQAQGAVRAGAGLLLSTEPAVQQMQADGLLSELEKTQAQVEQLAERAHQQNAGLAADSGPQLPSSAAVQDSQESLKATQEGQAAGAGIGGGEGSAVAWSKPLLALYGKAGLLSLTP